LFGGTGESRFKRDLSKGKPVIVDNIRNSVEAYSANENSTKIPFSGRESTGSNSSGSRGSEGSRPSASFPSNDSSVTKRKNKSIKSSINGLKGIAFEQQRPNIITYLENDELDSNPELGLAERKSPHADSNTDTAATAAANINNKKGGNDKYSQNSSELTSGSSAATFPLSSITLSSSNHAAPAEHAHVTFAASVDGFNSDNESCASDTTDTNSYRSNSNNNPIGRWLPEDKLNSSFSTSSPSSLINGGTVNEISFSTAEILALRLMFSLFDR